MSMIENREQQIKSASEIIAYGCSDELKAALIQDFPELAESEDERIRKWLLDYVKCFVLETEKEVDKQKVIAYLEKQKEQKGSLRVIKDASEWENIKEQKPAEWSEEDNEKLNKLCTLLRIDASMSQRQRDEYIDLLKSLRPQPHWKPSEEQMDALKNSAYGTYQNGDGPALRELYEQLKKLH